MTTFEADIDKAYQRKVVENHEKKIRAVAFIIDKSLVENTPVDTGRARVNWQVGLNTVLTSEVPWNDTGGKDFSFVPFRENDALTGTSRFKLDDTIYISNNLPYIEALNNGSSSQIPENFVERAVERGKRAIRNEL